MPSKVALRKRIAMSRFLGSLIQFHSTLTPLPAMGCFQGGGVRQNRVAFRFSQRHVAVVGDKSVGLVRLQVVEPLRTLHDDEIFTLRRSASWRNRSTWAEGSSISSLIARD